MVCRTRQLRSKLIHRSWSVAVLAVLLLCPQAALAQVITSGLRGTVIDEGGEPITSAHVKLAFAPTGSVDETTTNDSGAFVFSGKQVGGPYVVTATAPTFEQFTSEPLYLSLGKFHEIEIRLRAGVEEMTITGEASARSVSGKTVIDAEQIASMPTMSNDPKDFVRLNPEVRVDSSTISIAGANGKYNSITIDGIRQDDDFGLNASGYPTQRSPISMSAIQEISVEQSPFDVRYGRFVGGNINMVTKSGTNDYHASLYTSFTQGSWAGNQNGEDTITLQYRELQYGLTASGPLLKDRLHFFASFEGFNGTTPFDYGAADSTATTRVAHVTEAQVASAQEIAQRVYGYNAGSASKPLDKIDQKVFAKLDYTINQDHRISGTFQRTAGNSIREFAPSSTGDLYLTSDWYNKIETLYASSMKLYSNWTPEVNTALEVSNKMVKTEQKALNGTGFMEADIATQTNPPDATHPDFWPATNRDRIILGPDRYRHANELDNNLWHIKASADYLAGQNLVTAGTEFERLSIYNLFVPSSNGVAEYNNLADFEAKQPAVITYQNAITQNASDGAARFAINTVTAYMQDEVDFSSEVSAQAGLRYEQFVVANDIPFNQSFKDRYGFANTATLNGLSLLLPRVGLTYAPIEGLNFRGGFGLYSGSQPTVWVSNSYSNTGVTVDDYVSRNPSETQGFDGRNVPQSIKSQLQAGGGNVNALDPKFKVPSTWKASAGMDYAFDLPGIGDDFDLNFTYTYSLVRHGVMWKDLRRNSDKFGSFNRPTGIILPDGRPYYDTGNGTSAATNFDTSRGTDIMLTNSTRGFGHVLSGGLHKRFAFGLQLYGGYAYQNVKDVNPGTSTTAASSYSGVAVFDPNNPGLATSNYECTHRFIGVAEYSQTLVSDLLTSISMVLESRAGLPYSYTFGGNRDTLARMYGEDRSIASSNHMLFYVPKGDGSDVSYAAGFDQAGFDSYLDKTGLSHYRGKVAPRNTGRSPWTNRVDLRFAQELMHPFEGQKLRAVFDVQNLGNLIQPRWGRVEYVSTTVPVVDVSYDRTSGKYVYSNFDPNKKITTLDNLASVWRLQVGLVYEM
jgi:hypothetical protein